ncbi:hypothetical protein Tco_1218050 [Tanacetum coccineum]
MSNTNNNLQTQTSNAFHKAIMEAGGKDRPPMLAPGNYNPLYKFKWAKRTILVAEGSSKTTTRGYMKNYKNVSQDIRNQLDAEAEAVVGKYIVKELILFIMVRKGIWQITTITFSVRSSWVSTDDANHKFLRSLPPTWSNLAMTMRTISSC